MGGVRGEGTLIKTFPHEWEAGERAANKELFLTGGERGGRALIKTKRSLQKSSSFKNKISILKGYRVKPSPLVGYKGPQVLP
ncbi:hypothetical protein Pmob_1815 [Petrotoga mobilis SJ95]|uniref:Uncharacterized protein n=1 Tax=Petrotoga mobilis (strain DSM 10674 / SJ95) TaxID=403833 RepID=A9BJ16_PETMO|nr:hypothetical protein Pmob_1815 [Petrotoga mobilis SJ95]